MKYELMRIRVVLHLSRASFDIRICGLPPKQVRLLVAVVLEVGRHTNESSNLMRYLPVPQAVCSKKEKVELKCPNRPKPLDTGHHGMKGFSFAGGEKKKARR